MKKWKIIVPILLVAVLAFAFWYGGDAPGLQGWDEGPVPSSQEEVTLPPPQTLTAEVTPVEDDAHIVPQDSAEPPVAEDTPIVSQEPTPEREEEITPSVEVPEEVPVEIPEEPIPAEPEEVPPVETPVEPEQTQEINPEMGKDQYLTDPVPEGKPLPVEPEDAIISDTLMSCTMSVRCDAILNHMDWLIPGKEGLVPEDGVIFEAQTVQFYQGESVFNVLLREMKRNKIHMEFENTPMYHSAYIQGINNLYEFDVGELSGWMYKVNDWFPNYGCSRYVLQDGDVVEWVYSCDLGQDVGGNNAMN